MHKFKKSIIPEKEILTISETIKNGGVIAFPTDTVWGVGCQVENSQAVENIYNIKQREKNKPLILLGSRLEYLLPYIETMPDFTKTLVKKYFPGALTIILKKSAKTPDYITSGLDTVGIRIPDNAVILEILEKAVDNHVLATTSANISGEGAFSCKKEVAGSIGNFVDYVVDDYGYPVQGKESTVVHVDIDNKIKVFRQGAIILEEKNE